MNIALFGGAFDPPHLGHLELLEKALGLKFFDEILLIPTFSPPLKMNSGNDGSVAGPEDRLEMCKLLIEDLRRQCHSEASAEESRGILHFVQNDNQNVQNDIRVLDLEIKRGGKSYTIETVRELKRIYSKKSFAYPENQFFFLIGSDWVKDLPKWYKAEELLKEIEFLSLPRTKISSSEIREKIQNGQSISGLVPVYIEEYIQKHGLYK